MRLPAPVVVDYVPVPDVRTALALLGEDPSHPDFALPPGVHPGFVFTVSVASYLLDESDRTPGEPSYEQIGVGGKVGSLTAARDDALDALKDFGTETIEHRLSGDAAAFAAAIR